MFIFCQKIGKPKVDMSKERVDAKSIINNFFTGLQYANKSNIVINEYDDSNIQNKKDV